MLTHSVSTTPILILISLLRKSAAGIEGPEIGKAKELMENCFYWREASRQDLDLVLRLQHGAMAIAFFEAAKTLATPLQLEQLVGTDLNKLERSLEKTVQEAKAILVSRREKVNEALPAKK